MSNNARSLNKENQKFINQDISCRWFFGLKADNRISENWSFHMYGEYLYFVRFNDLFDARQLFPTNSVGLPINLNEEGSIIRKAIYE